jgi:hypothetical protein
MTALTGLGVSSTYKQLLQIGSGNVGLTASNQYIQDGNGTSSVLGISTTGVQINASSITINGYVVSITGTSSINGTFSGISSGTNTGDQTITLTGDVTGSGTSSFATTITSNVVTYAKFQQVAAVSLVGNPTGSLANSQGITLGASLSFSGTTLQRAALTGDVTASANGNATTIANNAVTTVKILDANVTYAKIQNVTNARLLGNNSGSAAAPSEISVGTGLSLSGSTLSATATSQTLSITIQRFTSGSGTYTPTANMKFIKVRLQAGGGGGGGVSSAGNNAIATGGNGGNYLEFIMTSAQVGASKSYAVGALGAKGAAGNNAGSNGGNTTFADWTCAGGKGGLGAAGAATALLASAASSSNSANTVGTGSVLVNYQNLWANPGFLNSATTLGIPSVGGNSFLSPEVSNGESWVVANSSVTGQSGVNVGEGGNGALNIGSAVNTAGGDGAAGIIIIEEFILS